MIRQDRWADRSKYGIGVPAGEVAKTPEEAESIAKRIGMSQYWFSDGADSA